MSHVDPSAEEAHQLFLTPEGGDGFVKGFLMTLWSHAKVYQYSSIGVAFDPRTNVAVATSANTTQRDVKVMSQRLTPSLFFECNEGALTSTATWYDVVRLQIQLIAGRCRALYIHHGDGTVETLGLWDPTRRDAIVEVPPDGAMGFRSLSLHYSGEDEEDSYVVDVSAGLRSASVDDSLRTQTWTSDDEVVSCPRLKMTRA